jgi:hypothetical protein
VTVYRLSLRGKRTYDTYMEKTPLTTDPLKMAALAEALDYYLHRLQKCNANQAAIDLYTDLLEEVDPEGLCH